MRRLNDEIILTLTSNARLVGGNIFFFYMYSIITLSSYENNEILRLNLTLIKHLVSRPSHINLNWIQRLVKFGLFDSIRSFSLRILYRWFLYFFLELVFFH